MLCACPPFGGSNQHQQMLVWGACPPPPPPRTRPLAPTGLPIYEVCMQGSVICSCAQDQRYIAVAHTPPGGGRRRRCWRRRLLAGGGKALVDALPSLHGWYLLMPKVPLGLES